MTGRRGTTGALARCGWAGQSARNSRPLAQRFPDLPPTHPESGCPFVAQAEAAQWAGVSSGRSVVDPAGVDPPASGIDPGPGAGSAVAAGPTPGGSGAASRATQGVDLGSGCWGPMLRRCWGPILGPSIADPEPTLSRSPGSIRGPANEDAGLMCACAATGSTVWEQVPLGGPEELPRWSRC